MAKVTNQLPENDQQKYVRGATVNSVIIFHPDDNPDGIPSFLTAHRPYVIRAIEEYTPDTCIAVFHADDGDESAYGSVGDQKFRVIYTPESAPKFNPVQITLETQNEVDLVTGLLAQTTGEIDNLFGLPDGFVLRLYQRLKPFSAERFRITDHCFHVYER